MQIRDQLAEDFLKKNLSDYSRKPIHGDASFRHYERIFSGNESYILMDAPPEKEKIEPFIYVAEFLHGNGFSAPEILGKDIGKGFLLLEDLGDTSFRKAINEGADEHTLYRLAADVLIKLHQLPPPEKLVDHGQRALQEVNRLIEWYFPLVYGNKPDEKICEEFNSIWQDILKKAGKGSVVCLFDYHSDNLMLINDRNGINKVGLLDFQDAVVGSPLLDLAALLQDIRREVSKNVQEECLDYFISKTNSDKNKTMTQYRICGAQWNTRILGTFARLSLRDKKNSYLKYMPTVWKKVEENLQHPALAPLKGWFDKYIPIEKRYAA